MNLKIYLDLERKLLFLLYNFASYTIFGSFCKNLMQHILQVSWLIYHMISSLFFRRIFVAALHI